MCRSLLAADKTFLKSFLEVVLTITVSYCGPYCKGDWGDSFWEAEGKVVGMAIEYMINSVGHILRSTYENNNKRIKYEHFVHRLHGKMINSLTTGNVPVL